MPLYVHNAPRVLSVVQRYGTYHGTSQPQPNFAVPPPGLAPPPRCVQPPMQQQFIPPPRQQFIQPTSQNEFNHQPPLPMNSHTNEQDLQDNFSEGVRYYNITFCI